DIALPRADFVRYVMERMPADASLEEALREARTSDLFLTCGCVQRDPGALAHFDRVYLRETMRALSRMPPDQLSADDLKQLIREKLLVSTAGRPPKIAEYTGRGDLRSWVQVIVVRTIIDLSRERKAQKRDGRQALREREVQPQNPEYEYLKKHYGSEFAASFAEALRALTPRQRNLLRQQVIHGLSF